MLRWSFGLPLFWLDTAHRNNPVISRVEHHYLGLRKQWFSPLASLSCQSCSCVIGGPVPVSPLVSVDEAGWVSRREGLWSHTLIQPRRHCQGINGGISAYFSISFVSFNDSFFFFLIREARELVCVPSWQCSM